MPNDFEFRKKYNGFAERIAERFEQAADAEAKIAGVSREDARAVMPKIFWRWLHSASVDGTLLSPMNLLAAYEFYETGSDNTQLRLAAESGSVVADIRYIGAVHPVVTDLEFMAKQLGEPTNVADPAFVTPALLERLAEDDPQYVAFLADIGCRMGVFSAMPSLNARVIEADPKAAADILKKKPPDQVMALAFDAAMAECAAKLSKVADTPPNLKEGLIHAVRTCAGTGELFSAAVDIADGMDPERIMDAFVYGEEAVGELITEIMGYRLQMDKVAVGLDMWFFTPLEKYLRFIRPVFLSPLSMKEEFRALGRAAKRGMPFGSQSELCHGFTLTSYSRALLSAEGGAFCDLKPPKGSPEPLLNGFIDKFGKRGPKFSKKILTELEPARGRVFTVVVSEPEGFSQTVELEIETDGPARDLYTCLCVSFAADPFGDYAFFAGDEDNPFKTWSTDGAPAAGKPIDGAVVGDVLEPGAEIKIVWFSDYEEEDDREFTVEVIGTGKAKFGYLYPRQTR